MFWHCEFGPQGEGTHGLIICGTDGIDSGTVKKAIVKFSNDVNNYTYNFYLGKLTWHAISKRISSESVFTRTNWIMSKNSAIGISSTLSSTWVNAFSVHACFVARAFAVDRAFWPTVRRSAHKVKLAATYGLRVYFPTLTVGTTWWRCAWSRFNKVWNFKDTDKVK